MVSRLEKLKLACEKAADERRAEEQVLSAHSRARILRAQFVARYGRDPLGTEPVVIVKECEPASARLEITVRAAGVEVA